VTESGLGIKNRKKRRRASLQRFEAVHKLADWTGVVGAILSAILAGLSSLSLSHSIWTLTSTLKDHWLALGAVSLPLATVALTVVLVNRATRKKRALTRHVIQIYLDTLGKSEINPGRTLHG
jgi:hypothetical protein